MLLMKGLKTAASKRIGVGIVLVLWVLTVWLVYPLVKLDSFEMENAKEYLYRSAFGIAIMLIFFGKSVFDLLYLQGISKKVPLYHKIFLSFYCFALTTGIIYVAGKMVVLYLKSSNSGASF